MPSELYFKLSQGSLALALSLNCGEVEMMTLMLLRCHFYNGIHSDFILPLHDRFTDSSDLASINVFLSDKSTEITQQVAKFCSQVRN